MELPKNNSVNKHIIELKKSKQSFHRLIYSLQAIELKILKTYIETYLKIKFIWLFKFFVDISIFFNQKSDKNLYLSISY